MPFISAVVAAGSVGAAIFGAGTFAATAANFLIGTALSVGLSAISALSAQKQPVAKPGEIAATLQVGGDIPRQVAFGRVGLKGHLAFVATEGPSEERLCQVILLSDGWCDGLEAVWVGNQRETLTPMDADNGAVAKYCVERFGDTGFGDKRFTVWFYDGRPAQPMPGRPRAFDPDRFEETDRYAGLTYVVVELINNDDTFDSIPDLVWELRGYRCHDPRKDPVYGGTGSHSLADPATWEFSENPAVHAWNYFRGIQSEGQVLMGLDLPDYDLLTETFVQAANICDEAVPLDEGGYEQRYRCSTVAIAQDADHRATLAPIIQAMAGYLIERNGSFGLVPGAAFLPVTTVTDDDIDWTRGVKWQGSKSRTERTNEVHGQFVDPAAQWQANSYPPITSSVFSTEDGERLAVSLDFGSITSVTQAQRAARIRMRETRRQATGSATFGMHLFWLEPGDWIRWDSAKFAQNRLYRIASRDLNADDTVTLQMQEIGNEVYSWNAADEQPYVPIPSLPPGPPLPSTVSNFTVQPDVITSADGSTRPILRLRWDPIDDFRIVAVIIEYRIIGTIPATRVRDDSPADGEFILDQPPTGREYEFRASIATVPARPVTWTPWVSIAALPSARFRVDYDDLKQGIRYRTQLLPDIDPIFGSALEGMVDAFEGRRLAETGIRKTEQVKQDLTQQLVSVTTEIRAQLDSGFADAFQQIGVLQTQTTSLAASYTGLSAQLQSGFAGYNQQIAALVTQDQAFAGSLTQFNARLGSAETGLSQEVALRANQYGALAQSITDLTVSFNNNAASTNQSLQALVSADQAIAQQVNQVNARLGNLLAEGLIQFAAVAAPAGVFARFAVILRAQAGGQPFETGLYLELIQQGSTFYGQFFVDTNRFVVGNPLTRTVPFSVIDGTTYIDNAAIRSGTITRHASASSAGRNVTTTLPVQVGGRVTIIGVYRGGQFAVNGSGSNIRIRRNGSDIEVAPVSYVNYPINAGGSQSSYNNTVVMASYDVGYNGVETIEVILDQATYVGGPFDLVGVSVSAVCNNK